MSTYHRVGGVALRKERNSQGHLRHLAAQLRKCLEPTFGAGPHVRHPRWARVAMLGAGLPTPPHTFGAGLQTPPLAQRSEVPRTWFIAPKFVGSSHDLTSAASAPRGVRYGASVHQPAEYRADNARFKVRWGIGPGGKNSSPGHLSPRQRTFAIHSVAMYCNTTTH